MKREVTREELARPLVPYEEAVEQIVGSFRRLIPQRVALADALGCVIAEDIVAEQDVPGFDNSAMDGYAVRAADTPGTLRVIDDVPAGSVGMHPIEPGTAAVIMTGAPIPTGADTVVPWEDTERDADHVKVLTGFAAGRHVRPRGEDVRTGDEVIAAWTELRPVHIGVLASVGRMTVSVVPRPRVAILSTGDELAEPGADLLDGQVYDANRPLLRAMCERAGAVVVADTLIGDDPRAMSEWLHGVAQISDLIVTSGGASVGEHDWIREVLETEGRLQTWRVAIKPGKPIAYGRIASTPVLGLPGNPGSAFVGAHVFVQPAIRTMAGLPAEPVRVTATLGAAVKGSPSRTAFARVRLDGSVAHPLPAQSSVVLSNLIPADGFAVVPPGGAPEGAEVTVELLA